MELISGLRSAVALGVMLLVSSASNANQCDVDGDGAVDINDIRAIAMKRDQPATGPDDPMDYDLDGQITALDARGCQLLCTLPRCAVPIVTNLPPTADAGEADRTEAYGSLVRLVGSGSDPEGASLSYSWTVETGPTGSDWTLEVVGSGIADFSASIPGDYSLSLVSFDGELYSDPVTVLVHYVDTNLPPIANAGVNQSLTLGRDYPLNGNASYDPEDGGLSYAWSMASSPEGSTFLIDAEGAFGRLIVDLPGDYQLALQVFDGDLFSEIDYVIVSFGVPPVADAGEDQTVALGTVATVNGDASHDPEGDILSYVWSMAGSPDGSTFSIDSAGASALLSVDRGGDYRLALQVDDGEFFSELDDVLITFSDPNNAPPVADAGEDQTISVGGSAYFEGEGFDPEDQALTFEWTLVARPDGSDPYFDPDEHQLELEPDGFVGDYIVSLVVFDGAYHSEPDFVIVHVLPLNVSPVVNAGSNQNVSIVSASQLVGSFEDDGLPPGGTYSSLWQQLSGPAPATISDPNELYTDVTFSDVGDYIFDLNVSDSDLDASDQVIISVERIFNTQIPADPESVATPVSSTVVTDFAEATAFLYSGENAIQQGIAPNTFDSQRVAMIRGRVRTRDSAPLSGVAISIDGHAEYGRTISRLDGMFDIAVNGGGPLTLHYEKEGFIGVRRQITVPWRDYLPVDDVIMLELDPQVTVINLVSTSPIQVARGTAQADDDGVRQATLMFATGTTAEMLMPDGSIQELSDLSVRLTEVTVGEMGPLAMPYSLPPQSAYTYAVELSVDEALAADALDVQFSKPISFYVENFLRFPVGTTVPVGSLGRNATVNTCGVEVSAPGWVPEENGVVIGIVGENAEVADVDIDGDGIADTAAALAGIGLSQSERMSLAQLYEPGQSLWRAQTTHFSSLDMNMPGYRALGAVEEPGAAGRRAVQRGPRPGRHSNPVPNGDAVDCETPGSIIGCRSQTLGQKLPIKGTPFVLHYKSDRANAQSNNSLVIQLSDAEVPSTLLGIKLAVRVAGQYFIENFPVTPDQRTTFVWDGKDAYGRTLVGEQKVNVQLLYTFPFSYAVPAAQARAFGLTCDAADNPDDYFLSCRVPTSVDSRLRQTADVSQLRWEGTLGGTSASTKGFGGWEVGAHHTYDRDRNILSYGDGRTQRAREMQPVIETVAGGGTKYSPTDDLPEGALATEMRALNPGNLMAAADGSIYVFRANGSQIYRIDRDGEVAQVAKAPAFSSVPHSDCNDSATLFGGSQGVFGPDGSIYMITTARALDGAFSEIIRRIAPDGTNSRFAGVDPNDIVSMSTDPRYNGGVVRATDARFGSIRDIAVAPDSSVYLVVSTGLAPIGTGDFVVRIRKDGFIYPVAGTGVPGFSGDGGSAVLAQLHNPREIDIGPDGSLLIAEWNNRRIRRVSPEGVISTVVGTGVKPDFPYAADAIPATEFLLTQPKLVKFASDGSFYFYDLYATRLMHVGLDGIVRTVAGQAGNILSSGDGGAAGSATVLDPRSIAIAPDGTIYMAERGRVRKIAPLAPTQANSEVLVPSDTGDLIFVFDQNGRHLRTVNSVNGLTYHSFSYDDDGLLTAITDRDGDVTTIERDDSGNPTSIVSAAGLRTDLGIDSLGFLSSIDMGSLFYQFSYSDNGLMTGMIDHRGGTHDFIYDVLGRLISDAGPAGDIQTLARTDTIDGFEVTLTSATGVTRTVLVPDAIAGSRSFSSVSADGTENFKSVQGDTTSGTYANGVTVSFKYAPDPRFGLRSQYVSKSTMTLPSGLQRATQAQRSVVLADEGDPFSLISLINTRTSNGKQYQSIYSVADRRSTLISPEGRTRTKYYDEKGRRVRDEIMGLLPFEYRYDASGRLTEARRGDQILTRSYDAKGRLQSITDSLGRTRQYVRDATGRVVASIRPTGEVVDYTLDAAGQVIAITPPGRPSHQFTYSATGQRETYLSPDVGSGPSQWRDLRNLDRRLSNIESPGGINIAFLRDSSGHIDSIVMPRITINREFDVDTGLPTRLSGSDGSWMTYSYDGPMMTESSWGGSGIQAQVTREFNNDFKLSRLLVNSVEVADYLYDDDGLLLIAGPVNIARSVESGFATGTTVGAIDTATSIDVYGALLEFSASSGIQGIYTESITERDVIGRILARTEEVAGTIRSIAYQYDLMGRLVQVAEAGIVVAQYAYDSNGNRTRSGEILATFNSRDQVLTQGTLIFEHAATGERTRRTDTATNQTTEYQYDSLGNLLAVLLPDGNLVEYEIDVRQRRVAKRLNGVRQRGFVYLNGLMPIAELTPDSNVRSLFVYGTKRNVPDAMIQGSTVYRIVSDHSGNVRLVVDANTGTIVQRLDYDAFGLVTFDSNPGFQPFGFAGGLYDPTTGLVRFGARDYDPVTGNWTAMDPILFQGGSTNLYSYAGNDPVNSSDANGLFENLKLDAQKGQFYSSETDTYYDSANDYFQEVRTEEAESIESYQNDILDYANSVSDPEVWDNTLDYYLELQGERNKLGFDDISDTTANKLKELLGNKAHESPSDFVEAERVASLLGGDRRGDEFAVDPWEIQEIAERIGEGRDLNEEQQWIACDLSCACD